MTKKTRIGLGHAAEVIPDEEFKVPNRDPKRIKSRGDISITVTRCFGDYHMQVKMPFDEQRTLNMGPFGDDSAILSHVEEFLEANDMYVVNATFRPQGLKGLIAPKIKGHLYDHSVRSTDTLW